MGEGAVRRVHTLCVCVWCQRMNTQTPAAFPSQSQ